MLKTITSCLFTAIITSHIGIAAEVAPDPKADGWVTLGKADFVPVNGKEDTWQWREDGSLHCTGLPVGVMRTAKQYKNFEMAISWCHLKDAGNSGVFAWVPSESLEKLKAPGLPDCGIEVQILDHGYTAAYENSSGKKATWFTTNGDVFAVGKAKLKPFPPISPDGARSFPSQQTTKGHGQWNHYLIRAENGTIRLWVNGVQVSGGEQADPASGFLCLESEGSPIDFKDIRIRELPAAP